ASSKGLEGARDHDFDGDAVQGLREICEDLRTLLLHVDADDFLAILLSNAHADDPAHLHEPRLVAAFHLGCRCHGSFMPSPGDKPTEGLPAHERIPTCKSVQGGGGRMKPSCIRDWVWSRARRIRESAFSSSSSRLFLTRARPCSMAFMPTAAASRAKTSISSIVGTMCSSSRPFSSATSASSFAAAMHISSVMVFARTSKVPRKMPGNPSELFT